MKYYVIKMFKNEVTFKKYKCTEGWSKHSEDCWQFSKQGATKIAERYQKQCKWDSIQYGIRPVA